MHLTEYGCTKRIYFLVVDFNNGAIFLPGIFIAAGVIIGIIVVIVLSLVGLAKAASNKLLSPPRPKKGWTPRDLGHDYENVEVRTSDGYTLRGWFIDKGSDTTIIAIHGYTASKYEEDYMKPVIDMLARNGYNVVAFDFRAHGDSDGEITTLGLKEVEDYIRIIDWFKSEKSEKAKKIGVIGYSMGGAVTIMLSARDKRINAAVADSPYIDIRASGQRWIMRVKGIMRSLLLLVYPLIVKFAASKAHINIDDLVMYKYASQIKIPFMIIAGRNDDLVALDEIKKFYNELIRNNPKAILWVTDSGHVRTIKDHPCEYEERVIGFFKENLG